MDKIAWDNGLSVGIEKLDDQHKELFELVNRLTEADTTADSEAVADALHRMTEYASHHFQTEEQLMRLHGYPACAQQERDHDEFKMQTARFCLDVVRGHKPPAHQIVAYLGSWLRDHILRSDMQYKPFFRDLGLK